MQAFWGREALKEVPVQVAREPVPVQPGTSHSMMQVTFEICATAYWPSNRIDPIRTSPQEQVFMQDTIVQYAFQYLAHDRSCQAALCHTIVSVLPKPYYNPTQHKCAWCGTVTAAKVVWLLLTQSYHIVLTAVL